MKYPKQTKSTKAAFQNGFLIKFFNGKGEVFFFIDKALKERIQAKSLPRNGTGLTKDEYYTAVTKYELKEISLTPNEIVLAGRALKQRETKKQKHRMVVVSVKKIRKEEPHKNGTFSDKMLDNFVTQMTDKPRVENYHLRRKGPGAILVYGGFGAGENLLNLAHAHNG